MRSTSSEKMLVLALGTCLKRCLPTAGLGVCRSRVYRISSSATSRKNDASDFLKHAPMKFSAASVVEVAPRMMQPYLRLMRIDKPAGTWLLYWPCTWSIALATPPGVLPSIYLLALFGAGSFFMRAAGCIINDIFDKKYDMKVERTRLRPLCSGELTNMDAVKLLSGLLSISLLILLQLNWLSVAIGASSLLLTAAYPFAKRYTYWPQFVLGATLNWGVLIAWSHLAPNALSTVIPLFTANVFHTVIYDTIYSHQDKADDIVAGVKSTALLFGDTTKYWLTGFAAVMISGLTVTGAVIGQTWPYYCMLGATAAQLSWQICTLKIDEPDDCWTKFKSNQWLGAILFTGIVVGNLLRKESQKNRLDETLDEELDSASI
uniref:4-hydroxybenzoate polyprenyltransferase, mitochondrial n=1 Tax=Parascaris univalens TaxID=6257 RepID=A0A915BXI0_PARUN